jgi:hypothetical protein
MKTLHIARGAAVALAGLFALAAPTMAVDTATLLGVSKNWKAFSAGSGSDKVCYTIAQPTSSEPKKAHRDAVGFLINDWPDKKARAQPEIVPGYKYKDDSQVTVQVGSDKFTFYTSNDGGTGSAWMKSSEEPRLIEAMQRGSEAIVTGVSAHGTMTHDTYSLSGLAESLAKVHSACAL